MAVMDAGLYQAWIRAFDNWDRAQRRFGAAGAINDAALTNYLRGDWETARREYNDAIKAVRDA